ncbi:ComEC/Rec2 family competence protein [Bradyrhizobium liaoningense]|uniref:ComEC/Rec2 family competence protein n=1 Tax=Bradyrhizobium liaoningense TaxID=43992 RepID=UPI001BA642C5|nr:MBL fold metallo-hydrolase [Bradyrhizobium liaoningense]MBR1167492.1 MBL fold metallo-hydrolase [Bradyrhizobium liaoningense]
MFKLHVIQAKYGDALLISFGTPRKPRHILIDGGPPGNYAADLEPALAELVGHAGKLDLVVLSHVDNDHIVGLLDLLAAVEDDQVSGRRLRTKIAGIWHNSFERTVDTSGKVAKQMQANVMMLARVNTPLGADTLETFYGIKEGHRLRLLAKKLGIPVNKGIKKDILLAAKTPVKFGPLELHIAGPNKPQLETLETEWLDWLNEAAKEIAKDASTAAMSDRSIPNLSSIVLLAKCAGKSILLTGDARGDYIIDGLRTAGLLKNGRLHVDVLKVQHHGSNRNTTAAFFGAITADTYVLSADGRHGNPKLDTLKWIVQSPRPRQLPITLVVTNVTETIAELQQQLPPADHGYTVRQPPGHAHSIEITLRA